MVRARLCPEIKLKKSNIITTLDDITAKNLPGSHLSCRISVLSLCKYSRAEPPTSHTQTDLYLSTQKAEVYLPSVCISNSIKEN